MLLLLLVLVLLLVYENSHVMYMHSTTYRFFISVKKYISVKLASDYKTKLENRKYKPKKRKEIKAYMKPNMKYSV